MTKSSKLMPRLRSSGGVRAWMMSLSEITPTTWLRASTGMPLMWFADRRTAAS